MAKTLEPRVESVSESIAKKIKKKQFSARHLNANGDMTLNIPGREPYIDVTEIEISYTSPMKVRVTGLMRDTESGLDVEESKLEVVADRSNPAEDVLYKENALRLKDPEITFYRGQRKTVLNQVQGIPVLHIKTGKIDYR